MNAHRCVLMLACAWLGACADAANDTNSPSNPSFDQWCDQHLCDWETRQGTIAQVGTWHRNDLAVSFEDAPTEISQLLEHKQEGSICLLFDTIADVAPEARLSLLLDFNDDGVADFEQQFAGLRWKSVPFPVRTPIAYHSVRLSVLKQGTGRAVLAQMRVTEQASCSGDPLTLREGSRCDRNEVCHSARCALGLCATAAGASAE